MAANLRIINANLVDTATVTASSSASASLGVANLLTDIKSSVWRSIGTVARLDVLLASAAIIGGVALPFTNLSAAATMRVRMSNEVAATNLLAYPRMFHNDAWIKANSSILPAVLVAPDGTMTGSKFVENVGAGAKQLYQTGRPIVAGTTYSYSIFVKPGGRNYVYAELAQGVFGNGSAIFNLVAKTATATGVASATIVDAPGGWLRITITGTATASASTTGADFRPSQTGADFGAYTGDGTSGIYVWHAQLEVGAVATSVIPDGTTFGSRATKKNVFNAAGTMVEVAANVAAYDYDPATRVSRGLSLEQAATNLIAYPRHFDNPQWNKIASYIRPNVALSLDGTMTADMLVESTAANTSHFLYQGRSGSNETTTLLYVLEPAGRTKVRVEMSNFVSYSLAATFDLSAGTFTVDQANADYTAPLGYMKSLGSGRYLCAFTVTKGSVNGTNTPQLTLLNAAGQFSYTGDGNSGVIVHWAQLTASTTVSSLVPDATTFTSRNSNKWEFNSVGDLTQYGNDVAVTAYDPLTLTSRGLSLEPATTNGCRNNTMVGTVVGVPGTQPQYWTLILAAGLSPQMVGVGSIFGINYVDYRIYGTATANGQINIGFDAYTTNPATVGQNWVLSAFVKLAGGSELNTSGFKLTIDQITSAGGFVTGGPEQVLILDNAPFNTRRQFTLPATITSASTAYVRPVLYTNVVAGAVVDITLRIGLPQIEQGFYPTSPIKTGGSTVTRAADLSTSPQATRAADVSTCPQVTRPTGYIDTWQSYNYDSGYVTACPGGVRDVWGWAPAQLNMSSFGFGGGSCARRWTTRTTARGVAIDISDPGNAMGYIEASRLVVGDYWSPKYNFDYGAQATPVDNTAHDRSGGGTQYAIPGSRHDALSINMQWLQPDDRASLAKIIRRNGLLVPMFVSLYPDAADPAQEADHQVYGRMSSIGALAAQSYGYYSAPLAIEQI